MKVEFEELSVREIKAFHESLLQQLDILKDDSFELDFNAVEDIDLCGIQLLIALGNYCKASKIKLLFKNINSTQVIQSMKKYNLDTILELEI